MFGNMNINHQRSRSENRLWLDGNLNPQLFPGAVKGLDAGVGRLDENQQLRSLVGTGGEGRKPRALVGGGRRNLPNLVIETLEYQVNNLPSPKNLIIPCYLLIKML